MNTARRAQKSPTTLSPGDGARTGGFALLVTITLLAFLVLLLVSLATLTRVETQVANNSQQLGLARQNALMALNIALGQLQKHTGPDRRITARAEILDTDPLNRDGDGNPVVDGVPNPYWTGVWDSSRWDPLTGRYGGAPINNAVRGRTRPDAIAWLVSGNENDPTDKAPTVALGADTRVLVHGVAGDGSIDLSAPRVEAPLVGIQSGAVPGLSGQQTVGRYAWWVGDEGVKASLSVSPPEVVAGATAGNSGTAASAYFYWKALAPHRAGGELMTDGTTRAFPDFAEAGALSAAGESVRAQLRRVLDPGQLPLIAPPAAAAEIMPQAGVRRHRFDLTAVSGGVLADTVRGGLRLDLTRYLQTGNTDGAFDANAAIYQDAVDAGFVSGDRLPAFSLIKSWYDIGRGLTGSGFSASTPWQREETSGPVITRMGVTPVVLRASLHYAIAADPPLPGGQVTLLVKPSMVLWNPHNVRIDATDLIAEIDQDAIIQIAAEARKIAGGGPATPAPKRYLTDGTVNYREVRLKDLAGWGGSGIKLRLQGAALEPGQTIAYGPSATGPLDFANGSSMIPQDSNLKAFTFPLPGVQLDPAQPPPAADEQMVHFWNLALHVSYPATATGKERSAQSTDQADNRFIVRLYLPSDYPASPLVNLRSPLSVGANARMGLVEPLAHDDTDTGKSRFWSAGNDANNPPFPRLLQGTDYTWQSLMGTYSFGNIVSLRLPFSGMDNPATGRARFTAALPYEHFNVRAALGVLTSFEMIIPWDNPYAGLPPTWESDPLYHWGINTLATGGVLVDHPYAGPDASDRGQGGHYILFDYPRRETASPGSTLPAVVSLGELQHVDFTSMGAQPGYALGNSRPDPRISRDQVAGMTTQFNLAGGIMEYAPVNKPNDVYVRDVPYLVNHALWDRFFLSTLPQSGAVPRTDGTLASTFDAGTLLPGTAMIPVPDASAAFPALDDVRNVRQAAGNLLLSGAFNINSTSVNAWRAFLGGLAGVESPSGVGAVGGSAPNHATLRHNYSRFLLPRADAFDAAAHGPGNLDGPQRPAAWQGSRYLSDAEIDLLARNLVEEVKLRGPFMGMADFVNRRLIPSAADGPMGSSAVRDDYRRKVGVSGALHKALLNLTDLSQGINAPLSQPVMTATSLDVDYGASAPAKRTFADGGGYGGWRGISNADRIETLNAGLFSQLSYGAPGFLTPGDVLQKIGAKIAARSDTFIIRAYGETLNPATATREGEAWLEAVVQRMPHYMDPAQAPSVGSSATGSGALNATNQQFGRRYQLISFRWLGPSDL